MLKTRIEEDLKKVVKELGYDPDKIGADVVCSIPKNSQFGEYTTNIALQLAKQNIDNGRQSPEEIANKISKSLQKLVKESEDNYLEKVEVAGGGFINFFLTDKSLMQNVHMVCNYTYMVNPKLETTKENIDHEHKKILLEYAQPNTHKAFHIGHTRNIILGESVARLLESKGDQVYRCTYGSDIGLPVAKAIWGVIFLDSEYKKVKKQNLKEKAEFLGKAYAKGATLYESDEKIKQEIDELNKQIYGRDPKVLKLWEETRQWSLDYLDIIYQTLGTKFDGIFVESQVESKGKEIVEKNIGEVFKKEEGAIIFPGEMYGLHTRVFITGVGNPTYEAKELGLAELEYQSFNYDRAIHIVDEQQSGYFQVVIKAIDILFPALTGKKYHLSYGFVDLKGAKMSSRTGDVVTFDYLFDQVRKRVTKIMNNTKLDDLEDKDRVIDMISIGAIKFTMLKYSPKTKIIFDLESSVALDGDSGPYIQYTYARAKSVLRSASYDYQPDIDSGNLEQEEKNLFRNIEHFSAIIAEASEGLNPTVLTNFLLDLSRNFNLFYQKHPIIKASEKTEFRLALTCAIAVILKQGLYLLGIEAPERM